MDELLLSQTPEYRIAVQAELDILGCLLVDPAETLGRIRGIVSPGDFMNGKAAAAYRAATALEGEGKDVDVLMIRKKALELGEGLDEEFCRECMEYYTTTANVAEHAKIVRDAARKRAASSIGRRLAEGELGTEEALSALQDALSSGLCEAVPSAEGTNTFLDHVSDAAAGKVKPFIPTGFPSLDEALGGGLIKSGLVTLAARPGTGKTTVALNLAERAAAAGYTTLYISLEMDSNQIYARRAAIESGLPYGRIYRGAIGEDDGKEWIRLSDACGKLYGRPFYLVDTPCTFDDIERHARTVPGLQLLCIDHIGLIRPAADMQRLSRYEIMTAISHRLKQLALSLRIPVLALCQLNRSSESRQDRVPTMADLRDSGAIEEDSDVVALLFRETAYLPREQQPKSWEAQPLDIIIDKNRHGMTGTAAFSFFGGSARIREEGGIK